MMKIKKGDLVQVITGKDSGKQGKVLGLKDDRVTVEGVSIVKRHLKANPNNPESKGEIIEKPSSIHISNVGLVCPDTKKPTRVGFRIENGVKVRFSKQSGKVIA